MEIEEYLTRIGISNSEPTIFRLSQRSGLDEFGKDTKGNLKGIWSHTRTIDRSVTVVGFITYDKPFPEQIFALDSEYLKRILSETDRIEIQQSDLVGSGNIDFRFRLEVVDKGKGVNLTYDNPPIVLTKEIIKKILKADKIIDGAEFVYIDTDGSKVAIILEKSNNKAKVSFESDFPLFHARFEKRFVEILKLVGENDVELNLDGYAPDGKTKLRKVHGTTRISYTDSNAIIHYYVNEITQKVREEKKEKEEEDKKDTQDTLPEE